MDSTDIQTSLAQLRELGLTATFVPGVGVDFDFNFVPGDGCFYGIGVMSGWGGELFASPYTLQVKNVEKLLAHYATQRKEVRRVVAAHIKAKGGEDKALRGYIIPTLSGRR